MHILKKIGWEILEYLRRALTPFVIKVMFGMTMFVLLLIENVQLRMVLMFVLLACDCVLSFVLFRSAGEQAYKMKQAGILSREQRPVGSAGAQGVYRPCKEYRPYKGFIIGLCICLLPLVLILVGATTGNAGCRAALLFTSGWAYLPVFVCLIAGNPDVTVPAETLWWGLIIVGVILVLCGVAYILGARVEKRRQDALERRSETIEEQKRARREKRN